MMDDGGNDDDDDDDEHDDDTMMMMMIRHRACRVGVCGLVTDTMTLLHW